MESELWRHRADVARRMHHSQPISGQDQRGLRQESGLWKTAARQFLFRYHQPAPGLVAQGAGACIELGVPTPAFSTALAFYDGLRSERLPANLLQAQRDYFGAHTYSASTSRGASSSIPTGQARRPRFVFHL